MINSMYPVIRTKKIEETSQFYEKYFGFERTFESDWYISLKIGSQELAVLLPDHKTIPEVFRGRESGPETMLNFEIENVDAVYKRFKSDGRKIHYEIKDEGWGQRHFIGEDPNGVAIDVIKVIPPSDDFLKQYSVR